MSMQALGIGWRAARQATREHRAQRRTRSRAHGLVAGLTEHGLAILGLGCFTVAAAMVAVPLGLAVADVSFFVLEWRAGE